jgi:anti-anti-sigma factor
MHGSLLQLRETPTDQDCCTVAVVGELDVGTAPQFRTSIAALLGTGCRHVVVDLSATTFLDSSGLGALVWAHHRLEAAGGDLVAVDPSVAVAPTLRITGVGQLLLRAT